jgi:hypothetical protein
LSDFPGETDEDFTATLSIVDEVRYASAYSFKYSARPGTPAAQMEGAVAPEVMDDRLQRLQARITEHSLAFNRATIGKDTQILIDRKGRLPGQMIGKSPWLQSIFVETNAAIGDMLDVTVTQALPNSLGGVLKTARLPDGQARMSAPTSDSRIEGRARLELEFENLTCSDHCSATMTASDHDRGPPRRDIAARANTG